MTSSPTTMTKEERLKLMKTIGARLDIQARMESNSIRTSKSDDEVVITPKKRGRPKKNDDEEAPIAAIESFNYEKLPDDAGVLQPHEQDIQDELARMNTYL